MRKGWTLLELTISITLLSILLVAISWVLVAGLKVWGSGIGRAQMRQGACLAIERMTREISQAFSITDAQTDKIGLEVDLDGDETNEEVSFSLSGADLIRTEGSVVVTLASNVQSFILAYRDLNNVAMSIPADVSSQAKRDNIRLVNTSLVMTRDNDTLKLTSGVYTRNQGL